MIKRSLYITVILIILFEALIRISNLKWDTSQNDKSANLISAQNFIYNMPDNQIKNDTVVIGSSISRKLVTDSLGKHFFNLAFNAWSSYDGLMLVKLTHKKPACLLIEMNIIGNQHVEPDVINSLSPVSYYPNTIFKSFQLQNQPVGLLVGYFKDKLKDRMEAMKKKKRENQELYTFNLQMEKKTFMDALPDSVFKERFNALKDLIDGFRKENIDIIFFEAPFDEALENTTSVLKVRQYYHQYFPEKSYKYIPMQAINKYIYSDGIHLSTESAIDYTLYLRNAIDSIKSKN